METGVPAGLTAGRYTAAQGRKFGVTVGLAFLAIAALLYWREHPTGAKVTGTLGAVLTLAALVVPAMLGPVERAWMKLALLISRVTTPIFMGIVYFLIITPAGYLRDLKKGSPIRHRGGPSHWKPHERRSDDAGQMERQF